MGGKGLDALKQAGFPAESLTILAKDGPDARLVVAAHGSERPASARHCRHRRRPGARTDGRGPQARARDLPKLVCRARCGGSGFSRTTAASSTTLTGRGGVLVAIRERASAADALAMLHSYGGGNAAIGAWTGKCRSGGAVRPGGFVSRTSQHIVRVSEVFVLQLPPRDLRENLDRLIFRSQCQRPPQRGASP